MSRSVARSVLGFLPVVLLLSVLVPEPAASEEKPQSQFWPEVDVFYRLDAQWRLLAVASLSRSRDVGFTEGQLALYIDYSFFPIGPLFRPFAVDFERFRLFQFKAGYAYSHSVPASSDEYLEHRGILEGSIRVYLTEFLLFSDRNRGEFRGVNGDFSFRYRNRVRFERAIQTKLCALNPYISAELFYDTRFETFNRQLYSVGIEWTLSGRVVLDTGYQRQRDSRSSPEIVNAFGVTVSVYY